MGAALSTLRDNFSDNSVSASAWVATATGSATVAETSGQARCTLPSSTAGSHIARYTSRYTYDLTSASWYINVETMVSTSVAATAFFQLYLDGSNALQWIQVSGTLTARSLIKGATTTLYTVTWNASTYKYLRIRADTTTVYFDSSTNGTSWTNRATVAISALTFPITDLFVDFGATCGNVASPGSLRLDDVNLIAPALSTTWRWTQMRRALVNRHKRTTLAIDTLDTVQGYIITADGVDASDNPSGSVRYWSGPAGDGRLLTEQSSEADAQAMAVNLPVNGSFDLPVQIDAREFRLGHRSVDGNSYTIYEAYTRRLVQTDDVEAESIRAINVSAGAITVDKLYATLTITGKNIQTAFNGARVVMSGDAFGGLVTYDATDTYSTTAGTGTYQILLSLANGKLYAGDGVVTLDDDGVSIAAPTSATYSAPRAVSWLDNTGDVVAHLQADYAGGTNNLYIEASDVDSRTSAISLYASDSHPAGLNLAGDASLSIAELFADRLDLTSNGADGINFTSNAGLGFPDMALTSAGLGIEVNVAMGFFSSRITDAVTVARTIMTDYAHNSSGTPGTNFGMTFRYFLKDSTTDDQIAARMYVDWASATHGSVRGRIILAPADTAGERECLRVEASGSAASIGFLGAAAVVRQTVTGSRAGNAALASVLTALANLGLITNSSSA